ncbi:hypothetical protein [Zavarzinia sp.]|uniref:hypothetical protein n=1 Tax=Zavarzinia sp. TaxID=2027920 RepID=UPI003567B2AB
MRALLAPPAIAATAIALVLAACAKPAPPPGPDRAAEARAAFGDQLEAYQGKPFADLVTSYGEPTTRKPASDGGTVAVWSRRGNAIVDGKEIVQDCDVTAFVDQKGVVSGIVAGGSTLFCARSFVPTRREAPAQSPLYSGPSVGGSSDSTALPGAHGALPPPF